MNTTKTKPKLRHIALSVDDPFATAEFYMKAFDMDKVGETDSTLARGVYLSDGVMNLALLAFKNDYWAGTGGKAYRGKVVLAMWVAPLSVDDPTLPLSMTAELYLRRSNGTLEMAPDSSVVTVDLGANTFGAAGCTGWKQVWMTFDVKQTSSLAADEFIGVRVWNPATGTDGKMTRYRVAFDVVGDFPAYLTVPEKP